MDIELEQPKPASKHIPDWYVNTDSYVNKKKVPLGDGNVFPTIKRCIPVFDAITSGYILTLPTDIYVSVKDGNQVIEWPSLGLVAFHPIEQAMEHPLRKPYSYPKLMNPWAIKTPKGYSCLFVQPFHREAIFTVLPGIVDTDMYTAPVNFPMVINDPNFEGFIPKGTPFVQVIPFKRDSWAMKIGTEKDLKTAKNVTQKLLTKFFDKYKLMFWSKKEYK